MANRRRLWWALTGLAFVLWPLSGGAQHTFSIAAVDPQTNEIGSAGATCLDRVMLNGEEGALVISDILPRVGVIVCVPACLVRNRY